MDPESFQIRFWRTSFLPYAPVQLHYVILGEEGIAWPKSAVPGEKDRNFASLEDLELKLKWVKLPIDLGLDDQVVHSVTRDQLKKLGFKVELPPQPPKPYDQMSPREERAYRKALWARWTQENIESSTPFELYVYGTGQVPDDGPFDGTPEVREIPYDHCSYLGHVDCPGIVNEGRYVISRCTCAHHKAVH
ncbi:hypothetical protein [Silvibacterium acidisoli]|uniref:hypothetical protein n=1 Tax=Acidobacteriaceae bacterium ZG23-2 TaxID=2883246 RepID=UPI00406C9CE6